MLYFLIQSGRMDWGVQGGERERGRYEGAERERNRSILDSEKNKKLK